MVTLETVAGIVVVEGPSIVHARSEKVEGYEVGHGVWGVKEKVRDWGAQLHAVERAVESMASTSFWATVDVKVISRISRIGKRQRFILERFVLDVRDASIAGSIRLIKKERLFVKNPFDETCSQYVNQNLSNPKSCY
eukprot:CAMPEP_0194381310 /NCGR_PEP_ID=MMETSP0174-20130528/52117_1 /TAXON_ID=216777 /ORGANISM="Proboscia alata, Strain PI-D3" /LENGTH=136 /DNA_ID=CAMNT_0039165533 /DNA_START=285 /DNA_END=695 /DNA_ORIENTATION=+